MARTKDVLPPPTIQRTGQQPQQRQRPATAPRQGLKPPPPLPTRSSSRPALPSRPSTGSTHPSDHHLQVRSSTDSNTSTGSLSTNSTGTSFSSFSDARSASASSLHSKSATTRFPLRAPAWGDGPLPELPPKKDPKAGNKNNTVSRRRNVLRADSEPSAPPPPYQDNNGPPSPDAVRVIPAYLVAPRLPPRTNKGDEKQSAPVSVPVRSATYDATGAKGKLQPPPPLPKPRVLRSQTSSTASLRKVHENADDESERPRPPPRPVPERNQSDRPRPPPRPLPERNQTGRPCPPPRPLPERNQSDRPCPPPRPVVSERNYSQETIKSVPPPPQPPRPGVPDRNHSQETTKRTVPPTAPKTQFPSLSSMNKIHEEKRRLEESHCQGDVSSLANDVQRCHIEQTPPPIPISTRPDLSKIQATKPRFSPSAPTSTPSATSAVCMKCRDFSGPDTHAAQFPRQSLPTHDLAWLAMQLTSPFPSLTDKARAIFTWFHHNIEYDVDGFFNDKIGPQDSRNLMSSGKAVCDGYASLFEILARHASLQVRKISGHGAGYGFSRPAPGDPIPPFKSSHAWNVVQIDDGYWKLVDPCWGAGAIAAGEPYIKRFDPKHFIMNNDEFGKKHFPSDPAHFYRDDGRPSISWEEYMLNAPVCNENEGRLTVYGGAKEHDIGEDTYLPAMKNVSIHQRGPVRFQFSLVCPHWTLPRHSNISAPLLFVMVTKDNKLVPFTHVPGRNPGGGGDLWYLDVADPRTLGEAGQSLAVFPLTSFAGREGEQLRGLTAREFGEQYTGYGWGLGGGIAGWTLV